MDCQNSTARLIIASESLYSQVCIVNINVEDNLLFLNKLGSKFDSWTFLIDITSVSCGLGILPFRLLLAAKDIVLDFVLVDFMLY